MQLQSSLGRFPQALIAVSFLFFLSSFYFSGVFQGSIWNWEQELNVTLYKEPIDQMHELNKQK